MSSYYEKMLATGEVKCIDDEISFEIPATWNWARLSNITSILGDGIHGTPEYDATGTVYFINGNNLSNGSIEIKADTKKVSEQEAEKHKRLLNSTTVLVSINGTLGNVAFYNGENVILGKSACYFNLMGNIDKQYIKHILETEYFTEYAKNVATGSTIKNVPLAGMRNFLIPVPPITEQHRIILGMERLAHPIDRYNDAQTKLDLLNNVLNEKLKKSVLQEAIQGKLVPQIAEEGTAQELFEQIKAEKQKLVKEGKLKKSALATSIIFRGDDNKYYEQIGKTVTDISEEIPFSIPDSWAWSRLSGVVNIIMGQSPDSNDIFEADEVNNAYEFHQGKISFTDKYIAPSGKWCKRPSRIADIGSLLVCVRAPIGDVNITQRQIGIGRGLAAITGYKGISPDFLFHWLLAHKKILVDKGTGSTFKAITVEVLKDLIIPTPPLGEQQRIVNHIETLYDRIKG